MSENYDFLKRRLAPTPLDRDAIENNRQDDEIETSRQLAGAGDIATKVAYFDEGRDTGKEVNGFY
jgi:hypothetical protein